MNLALSIPNIQTESDAYKILLIVFVLIVVPGVLTRALSIRKRRKQGQSWNEAIAEGTRLMTGNVWLDGTMVVGVAAATYAVVALILAFV
jgi:hypothetical protein